MSLLEHAQNRERGVRVKRYMPRVLHFSAFIIIIIRLYSTEMVNMTKKREIVNILICADGLVAQGQ